MRYAWVEGDGPKPCRLMVIAEAPAETECKTGIPLTGKTGKEFDNLLLRYIGLRRERVYTTNLFKYPLNDDKEYTQDEYEYMGSILREEIEEVDPDVILTLGAISTHWFLGFSHDMEALNGMPHEWEGRVVVPSIHPAASFRDSALLSWVIEAFENTKKVLDGEMIVPPLAEPTKIWGGQGFTGNVIAVDTESLKDGSPYLVTWSNAEGRACYSYCDSGLRYLNMQLYKSDVLTLLHNAPYDLSILWDLGIHPSHWIDTMQIAFLLQTLPLGLKALAYRLCRLPLRDYDEVVYGMPFKEYCKLNKIKKKDEWKHIRDLSDVPEKERLEYACGDPDGTLRVYNRMLPLFYSRMSEVLQRDMDIQPMIISMMERGMRVDEQYLERLGVEFQVENDRLLYNDLWNIAGDGFNPKSSEQTGDLLYNKLSLGKGHKIKRTQKGLTTDAKTLKKIEGQHPVVAMITQYRSRKDLIDKYIKVLPTYIQRDGRIHTKVSMVRVKQSGRLASSKPNLLAQPVRSADGRRIRDGFVAEEGYSIVSMDYSQIEMRLVAHLSQDPVLLKVYRENGDVHTDTAMRTFGIKNPKLVDEIKHRYPSKRTGFGVIYRISARGLSVQLQGEGLLEWTEEKCQWLINSWLKEHAGVKEYWGKIDQETRRTGQVTDLWGRMKLIPEIKSIFPPIREAGLRIANNVPEQSGAQGIIKEGMRRLWPQMREWIGDRLAYPLIQVHDDLVVEVRDDFIPEYISIAKPIMEGAIELSIPIYVEAKVGKRWGSQEKWKGVRS